MNNNFFNMLKPHQKVALNRLQRVKKQGSPQYHYDVGVIAGLAYVEFDIATYFPAAKKYEPLDTCLVINNDAVGIELQFNGVGGNIFIVPAGTIRRIDREDCAAIWQIRITNLDALIATIVNLIDIDFSRAPEDAEEILREYI